LTVLASLRMRVVLAMLGMSLVGLVGAYLLIANIERVEEGDSAHRDAARVAHRVAALLIATPHSDQRSISAITAGLGDDGVLVIEHGMRILSVPLTGTSPRATETAALPGGRVEVTTPIENTNALSLELTAVSGGMLLLVAGSGVAVTEIATRGLRRPITRAVEAADRVATGDFSARIGETGTSEFTRLAHSFDSMAALLANSDRRERHFLADLAHELATPLNVITGFAMSLADGTVTRPAEQRDAAELIAAETERLGGLFEDLRHLTRLDWNEVVRREPVDLAPLCHELFARFGPTARQNGVALFVRARTATVVTDRRLVDTVAVNLLTNALRYTPKGGSVTVSLRVRGRDVVLAVTDTGIGISPENKDHVFDRLYRVDEARDRVSGGSGLGLAIARRAALALDGRLEVDSTVGKGSEFRLVLPRASDPIDPDRAPSTERG